MEREPSVGFLGPSVARPVEGHLRGIGTDKQLASQNHQNRLAFSKSHPERLRGSGHSVLAPGPRGNLPAGELPTANVPCRYADAASALPLRPQTLGLVWSHRSKAGPPKFPSARRLSELLPEFAVELTRW